MYNLDQITKMAYMYENVCLSFTKESRIVKLPNDKYRVLSEKGKNLGTSNSKAEAKTRLKQIEYFKHKDDNKAEDSKNLDLTKTDEFSYSTIMRCLRPEKIALQNSLIKLNKIHPIKINRKLVKTAAISELGDPIWVGKYLADIIRFSLNRISADKRPLALNRLRNKIYNMNENEIGSKNMPATSSMGQSITFVKHVLFNHDPQYVRAVLNNITRNLV